MATFVLLRH